VLEHFGFDRCMYAADWAVFELEGKCGIVDQFELTNKMVNRFFSNDHNVWNRIFHENAIEIYNLKME
jgi:predicted TIM-barrel fold metal-dependent hydrolase